MGCTLENPTQNWYKAMNKRFAAEKTKEIELELMFRPDLKARLGELLKSFADWAGMERLDFKADLDEEVNDFLSGNFIRHRMFNVNVKEWMRRCCTVFKRDNYTCQYCGKTGVKLECDHVVPFSKGGSDELHNLTTACFSCNRKKKAMSAQEFRKKLSSAR